MKVRVAWSIEKIAEVVNHGLEARKAYRKLRNVLWKKAKHLMPRKLSGAKYEGDFLFKIDGEWIEYMDLDSMSYEVLAPLFRHLCYTEDADGLEKLK